MSKSPFRLEKLARHKRTEFDCGREELNVYFRERVSQDVKRNYATCFVAVYQETGEVAGYYTLSMSSLALKDLPASLAKKLPRYPQSPVARMGRLAVDIAFGGQGLGAALLADAVYRVAQSEVGVYALVVDAKDEAAAGYYERFGFLPLASDPLTLFLPVSDAIKRLGR